jgi:hypothetical protein
MLVDIVAAVASFVKFLVRKPSCIIKQDCPFSVLSVLLSEIFTPQLLCACYLLYAYGPHFWQHLNGLGTNY